MKMLPKLDSHNKAIVQISLTCIIWATTFVVVRIGVQTIQPLALAGLRFFLAGLVLLPFLKIKKIPVGEVKDNILSFTALGILSYAVGNGALTYALQFLPANLVSFLMSFVSPLILLFSILWLKEIPTKIQFLGLFIIFIGIFLYFFPQQIPFRDRGFGILMLGLLGFALQATLGRFLARGKTIHTITQTAIPLVIGGGFLLITSIIVEGWPIISAQGLLIIGWLAVFNSMFGYLLYNSAISELTAVQINVILNLSPFITALFAWILLNEKIEFRQIVAMLVVFTGTFFVQKKKSK